MNRDEILAMEPEELKVAIAEYVMGWKRTGITGSPKHKKWHDNWDRDQYHPYLKDPNSLNRYFLCRCRVIEYRFNSVEFLPDWPTDWNDMELVIEKMEKDGLVFELYRAVGGIDKWKAAFWVHATLRQGEEPELRGAAYGSTAPEAVCKAALLTRMEEYDERID